MGKTSHIHLILVSFMFLSYICVELFVSTNSKYGKLFAWFAFFIFFSLLLCIVVAVISLIHETKKKRRCTQAATAVIVDIKSKSEPHTISLEYIANGQKTHAEIYKYAGFTQKIGDVIEICYNPRVVSEMVVNAKSSRPIHIDDRLMGLDKSIEQKAISNQSAIPSHLSAKDALSNQEGKKKEKKKKKKQKKTSKQHKEK